SPDGFSTIGLEPASGIAIGATYAYLSGRSLGTVAPAIRLFDKRDPTRGAIPVHLESEFRVSDMRDVVLSADETRLFLVSRFPDVLLIVEIAGRDADLPALTVVGAVPLPAGPTQARLIPRGAGHRSLVAIACTDSNSVALYDDAAGQLANVIASGIGAQPFGIAVHAPPNAPGARLFVSNFGDGRISVIDIPDIHAPSDARVVALLGPSHRCVTDPSASECTGDTP
ncbi:MAG TPA: hypothetical protein VE549_14125, partial [Myxococcaceae bacterium]|nr:hypothetical protein [Myxococcaceae bacterium]